MRHTIYNILLLGLLLACGATDQKDNKRIYEIFNLREVTSNFELDSFKIFKSFDGPHNDIISFGVSTKLTKTGVGFIQCDKKSHSVKFNAVWEDGSEDFILPHFFTTKETRDPILLLCTVGAEFTYGVRVYSLEKVKTTLIGNLPIALDTDPYTNSTDPVPHTTITAAGDSLTFSFSKTVAKDFQGQTHKTFKPGHLSYVYKNGQLTEHIN
jgi:hypothetical protein